MAGWGKEILDQIKAALPASLGQKAAAASTSVVLASDQGALTVTLGSEQVATAGTTIAQTPTVTAGAYAAGDAVGGLLTFADAARVAGRGGVITSLVIVDDAGQDVELELWLFNQAFTAIDDNDAWEPSEADLENLVAVLSTEESSQGWLAAGTPSIVDVEVARRYDCAATALYGQLVTRGTPTFAATDDLTVKLGLLQD